MSSRELSIKLCLYLQKEDSGRRRLIHSSVLPVLLNTDGPAKGSDVVGVSQLVERRRPLSAGGAHLALGARRRRCGAIGLKRAK